MATKRKEINREVDSRVAKKLQSPAANCANIHIEPVTQLLLTLTNEERSAVESLGFGAILNFNFTCVRGGMCKWMLNSFDPETKIITIHGKRMDLKPVHVHYLLGFKDGGGDVNSTIHCSQVSSELEIYSNLTVDEMVAKLKAKEGGIDEFRRLFVMLVMTALFAPTSTTKPKSSWPSLLCNMDVIPLLDWSKFIFDELVDSARTYKKDKCAPLGGCLLFWMVLFCEFSVDHGLDNLSHGTMPKIILWDDDKVSRLHKFIVLRLKDEKSYNADQLMARIDNEKKRLRGEVNCSNDNQRLAMLESEVRSMRSDIDAVKSQLEKLTSTVSGLVDTCNTVLILVEHVNEMVEKLGNETSGETENDPEVNKPDDLVHENVDEVNEADVGGSNACKADFADGTDQVEDCKVHQVFPSPVNSVTEKGEDAEFTNTRRGTIFVPSTNENLKADFEKSNEYLLLDDNERALCSYVFDETKEPHEELVKFAGARMPLDRETLIRFYPSKWLHGVSIDYMGILKCLDDPSIVYVRGTLTTDGLPASCSNLVDFIFVSPLFEKCKQVFCVFYEKKHWFLVSIDMTKKKATLVDSCPQKDCPERRKEAAEKLISSAGTKLFEQTSNPVFNRLLCRKSETQIIPDATGDDCGVYVMHWMDVGSFTVPADTNHTDYLSRYRLQTLVRLMKSEYNTLWDEVSKKVNAGWVK